MLAQLGEETAVFIRRRTIDAETNGRTGGPEIDGTAHARPESRIRRGAVRDTDTVGAEAAHLCVAEMHAVRVPHVGRDPSPIVHEVERAGPESFEAVRVLVEGFRKVRVEAKTVPVTRPRPSTSGPPELPERTSPRKLRMSRWIGPLP